jgi:hypothetical protein
MQRLFFIAAVIWTLIAVLLLVVGFTQGEARMGAQMMMTFLGFPSSLLIPEMVIRLFPEMGKNLFDVHSSSLQYFCEWIALLLIGALQWFVLPYWAWRKWRTL